MYFLCTGNNSMCDKTEDSKLIPGKGEGTGVLLSFCCKSVG